MTLMIKLPEAVERSLRAKAERQRLAPEDLAAHILLDALTDEVFETPEQVIERINDRESGKAGVSRICLQSLRLAAVVIRLLFERSLCGNSCTQRFPHLFESKFRLLVRTQLLLAHPAEHLRNRIEVARCSGRHGVHLSRWGRFKRYRGKDSQFVMNGRHYLSRALSLGRPFMRRSVELANID